MSTYESVLIGMKDEYIVHRRRLVEKLKKEGRITSNHVENAFLSIPREDFIPDEKGWYAYMDKPLDIGNGQTISAPHMVAIMAEELKLKKGQKVLEIGAGSGYHAAVVSKIIGSKGTVYSIERIKSLADKAEENLAKVGIKNVEVIVSDGSRGFEEYAPYDRIYVTCAAPNIPEPLIDQLSGEYGILLIPVGEMICELQRLTKTPSNVMKESLGGCAFVPLIGEFGF